MLDNVGAEILPLACDEEAPLPDVPAQLLQKSPVMAIYQPRTHSATASSTTRQAALAAVLAQSATLIVEDDGIGDLSSANAWSLGNHFPARTIHVRSFSKAYGPDLRLAVLSATAEMVKRIQAWRNFGVSWTSRLLQDSVAWLLEDEETQQKISAECAAYRQRREKMLAARGIAVLLGERCRLGPAQFIRVSIASLPDKQLEMVASALAIASGRNVTPNADL